MLAFRIHDHTSPARLEQIERPDLAQGQILVRIAACGLNFADLLTIKGTYQAIPPLPMTLGMELAGTIEALGSDVVGLSVGDRVALNAGQGGLAEYGVFDAASAVPLPDRMGLDVAAGFLVTYGTSHLGLTRRARLSAGERMVVLGAAGGVGLTAVEIARALGAEVIAVARGADRLEVARKAGAHHLIDSSDCDLTAELKTLGGVDVIYDAVGGATTTAALKAARPEARLLVIGFASGEVPKLAANHLLVKNIDVIGFYWGAYATFRPEAIRDSLAECFRWYEDGKLSPHISHRFPLAQAQEALDTLAARKSTGKVVVTMGD
ncbi:NADPH:quinone oxidoreductase family protein [Palleronia caenipelagi]|uniref:NADPH:quinone oxidoreductase family protein n=1 Tax=Palleronia caenipelagi TaxID=2489174 RepID=A0A547QB93_9RHOB|nr:NADPH:quinone oxidoreductase family protein [Palleronia caenipelagi]TRD23596.1 NADPH:quinone oxidoreductase family protein [Palleronia caenipelagi]